MLVQLLLGVLYVNSGQLQGLLALVPEVESHRGDILTSFANIKRNQPLIRSVSRGNSKGNRRGEKVLNSSRHQNARNVR